MTLGLNTQEVAAPMLLNSTQHARFWCCRVRQVFEGTIESAIEIAAPRLVFMTRAQAVAIAPKSLLHATPAGEEKG